VRLLGAPVKLSRTPAEPTRPAPALGDHSAAVLGESGFDEAEIAALLESGAVAGPGGEAASARFMG
jgi:formyl-CoA transferase